MIALKVDITRDVCVSQIKNFQIWVLTNSRHCEIRNSVIDWAPVS